jgi:hypothetical protein
MNPMDTAWMILKEMNRLPLSAREPTAAMSPAPPPLDPEFMERIERNRANAQQNDQANSMRNAAQRQQRKQRG